jgi:hypothetical protein
MDRKVPSLLTGAAIVAMGLGLWATRQGANNKDLPTSTSGVEDIRSAISRVTGLDAGGQMALQIFATQPAKTTDDRADSTLVPEEWEEPLFGILMNEEQSMNERNTRLLELATGPAKGIPAVQEECLMHLLFGIPDSNASQFLAVTTNSAIPLRMRVEFLKEALGMRPTELGEWLSQQVSNHYEAEISTVARLFLIDLGTADK